MAQAFSAWSTKKQQTGQSNKVFTFTGEAFLAMISSVLVSMTLSMALPAVLLSIIIGTILMSHGKAPTSAQSTVLNVDKEHNVGLVCPTTVNQSIRNGFYLPCGKSP